MGNTLRVLKEMSTKKKLPSKGKKKENKDNFFLSSYLVTKKVKVKTKDIHVK